MPLTKLFIIFSAILLSNADELDLICSLTNDQPGCALATHQCPNADITFWLFTRETAKNPLKLELSQPETIKQEDFVDGPLIVLIHGYTGRRDSIANQQLRSALFQRGEFNVITVDYQSLAIENCYHTSIKNAPTIANCTAQLLDHLIENNITNMDNYHVIGHSLGAQISGMMSNYISKPIPRLTGLDPASPCFLNAPNQQRLDPEDAGFVEIVHTDIYLRGFADPAGHVDFYVNGGTNQPGCLEDIMSFSSCNHARAPLYYAESINSELGFWGHECKTQILCELSPFAGISLEHQVAIMGLDLPETTRGMYSVPINSDSPYAKGQ